MFFVLVSGRFSLMQFGICIVICWINFIDRGSSPVSKYVEVPLIDEISTFPNFFLFRALFSFSVQILSGQGYTFYTHICKIVISW